jgi:hypothetical protein
MMLDALPLWLVFVATVGFILLTFEIGFRAGVHRGSRSENERQAPIDPMVGSTLGLLAFVLAFSFGMATSRYDMRRQLVLEEALAIRATDLRAQLLPEQYRDEFRALLREYVDVRLKAAFQPRELASAIVRSEELQNQLWTRTTGLAQDAAAAPFIPALTQALIQVMEVHSKRVSFAFENRLPGTIWIALYVMTGLAMSLAGYRAGIAERRSLIATMALVLAFSAVILLIADLDRPQEGFLKVSQQAMLDLQARLRRE